MALFQYSALDAQGVEIKDEIDALSQKEAITKIRNLGYFPTKVNARGAAKKGGARAGAAPKKRRGAGGKVFYYGKGCSKCNGTGYRGRVGLFEIMVFNDEVRDLIMNQGSTAVLREAGVKNGMRLLRENGLAAIYDGVTTIDEISKETMTEQV